MKKTIIAVIVTATAIPMVMGLTQVSTGGGGSSATVKNSEITNENKEVTNVAVEGSKINSGIEARGSTITNSKIDNVNQKLPMISVVSRWGC